MTIDECVRALKAQNFLEETRNRIAAIEGFQGEEGKIVVGMGHTYLPFPVKDLDPIRGHLIALLRKQENDAENELLALGVDVVISPNGEIVAA